VLQVVRCSEVVGVRVCLDQSVDGVPVFLDQSEEGVGCPCGYRVPSRVEIQHRVDDDGRLGCGVSYDVLPCCRLGLEAGVDNRLRRHDVSFER